ncbi:MAG: ATP-binding protein [Litorimonas sp.]
MNSSRAPITETHQSPFALARQLQTAIWVFDISNERILHANVAACEIWGAEDELSLKLRDLSSDMSTTVRKRLKQFQSDFEAGRSTFRENWTIYPNDRPETLDIRYSGYPLPDGNMAMLCEVVERLGKSNENARSTNALLHTDVSIALFNGQGEPLYLNPAARSIFDTSKMKLEELFANKNDFSECESQWARNKDSHILAEVNTIIGKRWFDLSIKHSIDAVTGEQALLLTGVDITELKKMEREIKLKQQKFEATFSSSQDAIIIIDSIGTILEANHQSEEMFGFDRTEVIGQDIANLIIPDRYKKLHYHTLQHMNATANSEPSNFRTEIEAKRIDGQEFMSELSISRSNALEENSSDDIYVAYVRDITAAKLAERALRTAKEAAEQANKAKSTFLANMSHEIRTPMNGVLGILDVLQRSNLTEQQLEYTKIIEKSGNTLLKILSDILDLSKIESGQKCIHAEPCNLRDIIQNTVDLFDASAVEKGLELKLNFHTALPISFKTDGNRVQQILSNLVGNAIKFTPKGQINLDVEGVQKGNITNLTIAVTDTGIGIEEDKLEVVFNAFTQAQDSTTREYGGTGLGLAISRELAEAMGGTLTASSQPGKGTKFKLRLPLEVASSEASAQILTHREITIGKDDESLLTKPKSPVEKSCSLRNGRLNFLVVEDDEINRTVITSYLKHPKIDLSIAKNGLEAVEVCRLQTFDLIFMDVSMPVMGGVEATQIIRKENTEKGRTQTPIICVTAHAMKHDQQKFLEAGMDDYLSKPLRKADLMKKVMKWLRKSKKAKKAA